MNFINSIRDPLTATLFNLGCLMDAAVAVGPKDCKPAANIEGNHMYPNAHQLICKKLF